MTIWLQRPDILLVHLAQIFLSEEVVMYSTWTSMKGEVNRRSFLKSGLSAGVATAGAGFLGADALLAQKDKDNDNDQSGQLLRMLITRTANCKIVLPAVAM